MHRCSFFILDKALFGAYPTQEYVYEYENIGVRYFIDLTLPNESGITPYVTKYTHIKYPIKDHGYPWSWHTFSQLIIKVGNIIKRLKDKEKVYIHCRAGIGRSGIVVACLLSHLFNATPTLSLERTSFCHSQRIEMRDKRRLMGAPNGRQQKHFVMKFFEPIYMSRESPKDFDNTADVPVIIPDFGMFPSAAAAYHAHKDPDNSEYVKSLELSQNNDDIEKAISISRISDDWHAKKEEVMYKVLKYKFIQHYSIREVLLNTGLRPIIYQSPNNIFWGINPLGEGENKLGKALTRIREELYEIY
jgi:ribA/ribD-fused uncharacterized protein